MPVEAQRERHLLIFYVGGHVCALDVESILELVLMPALVLSPAQPAILDGFLNRRGIAVPVVAVHRLFHLAAPEPGLHTPLIITAAGGGLLALRVDRVADVAVVKPGMLQNYVNNDSLNDCAEAQFTLDERDIVVLNKDRLLLAKERECLAGLQSETQRRLNELEGSRT